MNNLRFPCAVVAALSFAVLPACSDPPVPAPVAIDGPRSPIASLTLAPIARASAPGKPLQLAWTVLEADAHALQIGVKAPGVPYATNGNTWLQAGAAPATGPMRWLKPDGTWSDTPVTRQPQAATGELSLALPSEDEGEWQVVLRLVDPAGVVVAMATASVLVASRPTVLLGVNRLEATRDASVRVSVVTGGRAERAVQLSAWITDPAGVSRPLPGDVWREPILVSDDSAELELHAAALATEGTYRVSVRLDDAETGRALSRADASIAVCDAGAEVGGTVHLAGGAAASGATVQLHQLGNGLVFGASADATGRFGLTLPPGRYLVQARALSTDGLHSGAAPGLLLVGCDEASRTVDVQLALTEPGAVSQPLRAEGQGALSQPLGPVGVPIARDGLPKPRIYSNWVNTNFGPDAPAFGPWFVGRLAIDLEPDFVFSSLEEIRQDLEAAADAQLSGETGEAGPVDLDAVAGAIGADFLLTLTLSKIGNDFAGSLLIINPATRQVVMGQSIRASSLDGFREAIEALLAFTEVNARGTPLLVQLREGQARPLVPRLRLATTPERVVAGGAVTVTAWLSEASNGAPTPGVELVLSRARAGAPDLRLAEQTDASGRATFTFVAGTTIGLTPVVVKLLRNGAERASQSTYVDVIPVGPPQATRLGSARVHLHPGDSERVTARVVQDGQPVANTTLAVSARGGSVDTESVRTDAEGTASFEFVAGNQGGPARALAEHQGQVASLSFYVVPPAAITIEADPFVELISGGATAIVAKVLVGGEPAPDLTVEYTLAGEGRLSSPRASTDADGSARVVYVAPDQGSGLTSVTAAIVVDSVRYEAETVVRFEASCPGCPIGISPSDVSVARFGTVQFRAPGRVSWSATGGTITGTGKFTANGAGGLWHVKATSLTDSSRSGSATVTIACKPEEFVGTWSGTQTTTTGTCRNEPVSIEILPYTLDNGLPGVEFTLLRGDPTQGCRPQHSVRALSGCRIAATEYGTGSNCALAEWAIEPHPDGEGLSLLRGTFIHRMDLGGPDHCDTILDTTVSVRR